MPDQINLQPRTALAPIAPRKLRWSRRNSTRTALITTWIGLACLAWASGLEPWWTAFKVDSVLTAVFFFWPFLEGPYRLYTRSSRPLHAEYQPFMGEIQPSLPQYRSADLEGLGFRFIGYIVQEPSVRQIATRLALFVHGENGDSAQLAHVVSGLRTVPLLVYKTRFDDNFAFETSNSNTPKLFEPDPNFPTFRFPTVRSTGSLYRLHCKIRERVGASRRAMLAEGSGEIAEFIAAADRVNQRHVGSGRYKLSPTGDRYVYTLTGAIRHSWLHTWPVKQFRQLNLERSSLRFAEELGLRIHSVFGCLQEEIAELRQRHNTSNSR